MVYTSVTYSVSETTVIKAYLASISPTTYFSMTVINDEVYIVWL